MVWKQQGGSYKWMRHGYVCEGSAGRYNGRVWGWLASQEAETDGDYGDYTTSATEVNSRDVLGRDLLSRNSAGFAVLFVCSEGSS